MPGSRDITEGWSVLVYLSLYKRKQHPYISSWGENSLSASGGRIAAHFAVVAMSAPYRSNFPSALNIQQPSGNVILVAEIGRVDLLKNLRVEAELCFLFKLRKGDIMSPDSLVRGTNYLRHSPFPRMARLRMTTPVAAAFQLLKESPLTPDGSRLRRPLVIQHP
ncbi:hypothetical protein J6590_035524 [Homalodisca vitripennis]|nr:hypothetical protein J6590_035524 [Homalodisca vitripennis]